MLDFSDTPYIFFPPKPNRILIWILRQYNRYHFLPGKENQISVVTVTNAHVLKQVMQDKRGQLLFLPNHPSHSDPPIMMEAYRQCGVHSQFMATHDLFQQSKMRAWIMQRAGAFSVDREGSGKLAMLQAMKTLSGKGYALTIFPEGNVYLRNDQVTPFLDGTAFLGMKAQQNIGENRSIYAIPVAVKLTHIKDTTSDVTQFLSDLAVQLDTQLNREADPVQEIKRIGMKLLKKKLRQRGYMSQDSNPEDFGTTIQESAQSIISKLEKKMSLKGRPSDSLIDRVRKIRRKIHHIRVDLEQTEDHSLASSWADEAILAFRILTYSGDYLDERPTIDRYAESVEKLSEDYYSRRIFPYTEREAFVHFGDPINLAESLDAFRNDARQTIQNLTQLFEQRVQEGLDKLNEQNALQGCHLFSWKGSI